MGTKGVATISGYMNTLGMQPSHKLGDICTTFHHIIHAFFKCAIKKT
jgi:hypothetical protein